MLGLVDRQSVPAGTKSCPLGWHGETTDTRRLRASSSTTFPLHRRDRLLSGRCLWARRHSVVSIIIGIAVCCRQACTLHEDKRKVGVACTVKHAIRAKGTMYALLRDGHLKTSRPLHPISSSIPTHTARSIGYKTGESQDRSSSARIATSPPSLTASRSISPAHMDMCACMRSLLTARQLIFIAVESWLDGAITQCDRQNTTVFLGDWTGEKHEARWRLCERRCTPKIAVSAVSANLRCH